LPCLHWQVVEHLALHPQSLHWARTEVLARTIRPRKIKVSFTKSDCSLGSRPWQTPELLKFEWPRLSAGRGRGGVSWKG
jgi:hypothetical protein